MVRTTFQTKKMGVRSQLRVCPTGVCQIKSTFPPLLPRYLESEVSLANSSRPS